MGPERIASSCRTLRRYGGDIVHFGIVLLFIVFAGAACNTDKEQEMIVGDQRELGPYALRLRDMTDLPPHQFHSLRL